MKKKIFFAAVALVALASCTSDDFIGENNNSPNLEKATNAIVFSSGTKATTRATHTGAAAATMLGNNFVFAGTKGSSTPASFVFDQYNAYYVANTAYTTESNSNDWEYVSYTPATTTKLPSGATQSIKYWDYSADQYDFAAYSFGTTATPATATAIDKVTKSYEITGTAEQLKACYISDLVTAYNKKEAGSGGASDIVGNDFGKVVQFSFRSLAAKIRLAFYETIPGYSVKDIKFYKSSSTSETLATDGTEYDPTLFASSAVLPTLSGTATGTMVVSFPTTGWANSPLKGNATDYNKAHVTYKTGGATSSTLVLEDLANFPTTYEGQLTTGNFIGRASNEATYAGGKTGDPAVGKYYTILPYEAGDNLTLRIKYTLVSTDGSNETIHVDNATAVIPKELAKWSPNYAYTYIFKISDMTNGSTGVDGNGNIVTGLTPITLNAVVVDSEDGLQETITTVSAPSITTYTKGKVVTTQSEYSTGANIYIIVNNGTSNEAYDANKFKLYTATLETGAAQTLNEASVDNAFKNGTYNGTAKSYTVHDANAKNLVLTESTLLGASTQIDAADSPTGTLITVNGAKFKPTAAGNYVFQYEKTAPSYTAVAAGALTVGKRYYTSNTGAGIFTADGTETSDGTNYFEITTPGVYQYKIIIVL